MAGARRRLIALSPSDFTSDFTSLAIRIPALSQILHNLSRLSWPHFSTTDLNSKIIIDSLPSKLSRVCLHDTVHSGKIRHSD